jgi:hypothetical protein
MMWLRTGYATVLVLAASTAQAVDYRLEPLAEAAPAEAISTEILARLQPQGFQVFRGANRSVIHVWLAQEWAARADFERTAAINYPFPLGELVGVVRYKSKGKDFRGQEIPTGVYVLRYANQPVDGNHVGTSDTRDFLVLTPADTDQTAVSTLDEKALFKLSAQVAGKTHPTMLSLVPPSEAAEPALRHLEEHDWWIAHLPGRAAAGDAPADQPLDVVLVGQAEM